MSRAPLQHSLIHARAVKMQAVARYLLTGEEFARLRDRLAAYCGVHLDVTRQHILEQAVAYRLQVISCDFAAYERRLRIEREELQRLAELVVNHETYFFRNQPHTRALREVLLPELHRRKPKGEPIRLWSAGCATGEEAYSLAITAMESIPRSQRPIEVWATDISEDALATARVGIYSGRALTNVEPDTLAKYFEPATGTAYRVTERVRQFVRFERVNLLEPLPDTVQGIDIVFCQNVIIYFQLATSRAFLRQLYDLLPEGSMVCLGFSETLWNVFDAFRTREVLGSYVYYKEALTPNRASRSPGMAALHAHRNQAPRIEKVTRPRSVTRSVLPEPPAPHVDAELLRQGRELIEGGHVNQALDVLRKVSPQSASASQALTLIARAHADRGEIELALAEAQRAVEIEPLNDELALLLGVLYSRQGAWDSAVAQLERARYLNSASPLISFQLAEAYRQQKRNSAAQREYRNTLHKLQSHPPETIVDGVAVGWLRETCQRQMKQLIQHSSKEKGR